MRTGFWLGKLHVKQPGKPRHKWKGNIKMNVKEIGSNTRIGYI